MVQTRKIGTDDQSIKKAIRYNFIDSTIALNAAFFVNAGILVLAATVFFNTGNTHVAKIEDAHQLLKPLLGSAAPVLFAIALIAAGQSSTVTGTLAGQIIMEGYLKIRINPLLRRLITRLIAIVPAVLVILIYGEDELETLLVLSQVILSVQLAFAVIPLIHFVSDKSTMGKFAIRPITKILAWLIAFILVTLNVKMVIDQSLIFFETNHSIIPRIIIALLSIAFIWLFGMMTFLPIIQKRKRKNSVRIHNNEQALVNLSVQPVKTIAIALDFSSGDEKLIAHAIAQGSNNVQYVLIHIIESATAKYLGKDVDDDETRADKERLDSYAIQLQQMGYTVTCYVGYRSRVKEIIRLVQNSNADMLVMGAHRHSGLKDYLFGETIESVRHGVDIPVLIVNV